LLWDSIAGADLYKITVRPSTSSSWTIVQFKNNQVTRRALSGLSIGTKYFWTVNARVNGVWTGPAQLESFKTPAVVCMNPTGLSVSNIKEDKAKLNWNLATNATRYRLRYRAVGSGSWISKAQQGSKDRFFLRSLLPSTTYEWQIRTICGGNRGNGWINGPSFTTITPFARFKSQEPSSALENLKVYPNPSPGEFTIAFNRIVESARIRITDINSRIVFERTISNQDQLRLDPQLNESGVYLIFIEEKDQRIVKRLVIQK
jgi:hypothetical protein